MTTEHSKQDSTLVGPRRRGAVDALYAAGHAMLQSGRFAEAACVCRALLAAAPHDERAWLALGACHEGLSENAIALQLYGAGSALLPKSVRCDLARARLFERLGDDPRAEEALERAKQRAEALDDSVLSQNAQKQPRWS